MRFKILEELKKASSICVFTHVNEDGDCVGSAFAFRECMRILGKKADVYVDAPVEERLAFLGTDYIVYHQPTASPYDVAVALDCASVDRLKARQAMFDSARVKIVIDHHGTNIGFGDYNIIEPEAIATGQILYYLFKDWGVEFTPRLASCLYTAIASDSGSFKYKNVNSKTFMAAAGLVECGIDHSTISRLLFDTEAENNLKLKGYLMSNIKTFMDGKIALISSDKKLLEKYGVNETDASNFVDIPRVVSGALVAIEIKERSGQIRFSLRANTDCVDVSTIAQKYHGGGHRAASGATLEGITSLEVAEQMLVSDVSELIRTSI